MTLIDRITAGSGGFLTFALTPPRSSAAGDRAREIADATLDRLRPLDLDGLVLYDIADEASRNPAQRPFPFMPTLDPATYFSDYLTGWHGPVVVYRAVTKYPRPELQAWIERQDPSRVLTVLVGAASRDAQPTTSLTRGADAVSRSQPTAAHGGRRNT